MELPGLAISTFGITKQEALANNICIRCKIDVAKRIYSPEGHAEYKISGMCELCFDTIMSPPEEPMGIKLIKSMTEEEYAQSLQHDHAEYAEQYLMDNDLDGEFEVRIAKDNELFLDYDQEFLPEQFFTAIDILRQYYNTLAHEIRYIITISKSNNIHVIVTLPEFMNIVERVAWQASFGADPKSNALQLLSIKRNEKNPILLYERKQQQALCSAPELLMLSDGQ